MKPFQEVTPERFEQALLEFARLRPDMKGFLTWRSTQQMREEQMRVFLNGTQNVGFGLHPSSGDIRNLFNASKARGAGAYALAHAIAEGGRILDCFDTRLVILYHDMGFVETAREPWNDALRPAGWDEARFGRPDVVFMRYLREQYNVSEIWFRYSMAKAMRLNEGRGLSRSQRDRSENWAGRIEP